MKNFSKKLVCVAMIACVSACSPSGAQAQNVTAATGTSDIKSNWVVDNAASTEMSGDAFTGSFGNFTADIQFDADDLSDASILVSIDMTSADAQDDERNEALPGKEWFFVKKFPKAVFSSTTVKKTGDNQFEAVGELTIRDITKPLTLPFELIIENNLAKASAKTSLNRSDFGVGTGMWKSEDWVVHNVDVSVVIIATATP